MNRLTYDDDLFLRMECVLDVPVVNQIVWRFDEAVPPDALARMWRHLDAGPINRRVHRVRLPGARDRWVRGTASAPLEIDTETLAVSAVGEWMTRKASVALDPLTGPVWQLSTAHVEGGGSVVSLVASHVVGDGGALTSAAIAALGGQDEPADFRSSWTTPAPSDVRDAVGQVRSAVAGAAMVIGRAARSALSRGERAPSSPTAADQPAHETTAHESSGAAGRFTPSTIVVDCPTERWSAAAAAVGGSSNSLLVAIALGVLTASGRVDESVPVKVSLPVSTRVDGDLRANATSGVSIVVDGGAGYRTDLSSVRARSKTAFTVLADDSQSTDFELTKPLMQMLPDVIVAKAAQSATAPLCLCSNLGDRGAKARLIGGLAARSVAMRSITQNTTAELLRRTKGGVSVWWNTSGETATLCVTGLDPDVFPTPDHLRTLVAREYERWQLTPTFW